MQEFDFSDTGYDNVETDNLRKSYQGKMISSSNINWRAKFDSGRGEGGLIIML